MENSQIILMAPCFILIEQLSQKKQVLLENSKVVTFFVLKNTIFEFASLNIKNKNPFESESAMP